MIDGAAIGTILRMVVSLAAVLALLIVGVRLLERRGVVRDRRRTAVNVEVLARTHLTRGSSVQIVRLGSRIIVLGVTDSQIRVLTDLSPADVEPDESTSAESTRTDHDAALTAARRQGATGRWLAKVAGEALRREGKHRVRRGEEGRG